MLCRVSLDAKKAEVYFASDATRLVLVPFAASSWHLRSTWSLRVTSAQQYAHRVLGYDLGRDTASTLRTRQGRIVLKADLTNVFS